MRVRRFFCLLRCLWGRLFYFNASVPSLFSIKIFSGVRFRGQRNIFIDDGVVIYESVRMNCYPGEIRVGRNTSIGDFSIINSMCSVIIGDNVLIAPSCHITDANHTYDKVGPIKGQGRNCLPVVICDGAWLGAGVKIMPGVRVGFGAIVAAGSVVTKSVDDGYIVAGIPARVLKLRDGYGKI